MNKFEQHIKTSLENYEAKYDPADWTDLQNRLNRSKAGKSTIGKGLLIAASVAAVAGAIYYFSTLNSENIKAEKTTAPQTIVSAPAKENAVQPAQNPSEKAETKNPQTTAVSSSAINSAKEKVTTDNRPASPEKTEAPVVNTTVENKTPVVEQAQPSNSVPQSSNVSALKASFHADPKICEDAAVQFTAEYNDASCAYKWSFGDGETSDEQNPKHIYSEAKIYLVKLRITSKDKKSDEQKNNITVLAAPVINMDYTSTNELIPAVNFTAAAEKVSDWKWEFGDKTTSSEQNPEHTYNRKGNYDITLTARNSSGCAATIKRNIKYEYKWLAPTGFSPNGDGHNDTWIPAALLNGDCTFTLTIMDKMGNPIYETSDKDRPWDGANTKVGDTFQWKIILKDRNGKEITDRGVVTIAE